MAKIKVHAGDFRKGELNSFGVMLGQGSFTLLSDTHPIMGENISITQVAELDLASEDSVKRMGGAVGWGVAGGVLFGPAGLLAGLLLGGKGKETTFVCQFKDGRKLMGTMGAKDYQNLQASLMDAPKQAKFEQAVVEAQQKAAEKKAQKSLRKPSSGRSNINLYLATVAFGLFALISLQNGFWGFLVFAAGAVFYLPQIQEKVSVKLDKAGPTLPKNLNIAIGFVIFILGSIASQGISPKTADSVTTSSAIQQETPVRKQDPVKQVVPGLMSIVGQSQGSVSQLLGQSTKSETVNSSGLGCPCPKEWYAKDGIEYQIVYSEGNAEWITVSKPDDASLGMSPSEVLSLLGLPEMEPTEANQISQSFFVPDILSVSFFLVDDKNVDYAYIKASKQ